MRTYFFINLELQEIKANQIYFRLSTMRTRSSASKADEIHFITGGGGYPGFCLGKNLIEEGHKVKLFDIQEPVWDLLPGMEFIKVNNY